MLTITYHGELLAVDASKLTGDHDMVAPSVIYGQGSGGEPGATAAELWEDAVRVGAVIVPSDLYVSCYASDDEAGSGVVMTIDHIVQNERALAGITAGWADVSTLTDEFDDYSSAEAVTYCLTQMVAEVNRVLDSVRVPVLHRSQIRRVSSNYNGYEPYCTCGWLGQLRILATDAQEAANVHVRMTKQPVTPADGQVVDAPPKPRAEIHIVGDVSEVERAFGEIDVIGRAIAAKIAEPSWSDGILWPWNVGTAPEGWSWVEADDDHELRYADEEAAQMLVKVGIATDWAYINRHHPHMRLHPPAEPNGPFWGVAVNVSEANALKAARSEPISEPPPEEEREPTDDEIFRYGIEGGIAYDVSDNRTEDEV